MTSSRTFLTLGSLASALLACSNGGTGPDPDPLLDCSSAPTTSLAVGQHTVVDAAETACVRLPAAGAAGAGYLYVALSGQGEEDEGGVTAGYELTASTPGIATVEPQLAQARRGRGPTRAASFHATLREREQALSRVPGAAAFSRSRVGRQAPTPPVVGDKRTFEVCETPTCESFVNSTATAKVVAERVAIFVDDGAPAGGYTDADLANVGRLFDDQLYAIDTTAFGRESDLDDNGVVVVLLTQRINELSPNCDADGSVILGYFFGLDLLPAQDNSNGGEIFYSLVPDPDNSDCGIDKEFATDFLAPVFIHEFQHMISFNQHVLVRNAPAEETWLNEGLSHFAEELGGRLIPDTECQSARFASCEAQFIGVGNLDNAYAYLDSLEQHFLIEPAASSGQLPERGANWLFVRWLADHFASTLPAGTDLTRQLVQTSRVGSDNVTALVGEPFDKLVAEWQLANYLDNLAGFTPASSRLQYTTWNFRELFQVNFDEGAFAKPYPLTPDSTTTGSYSRLGVLRGGSGRHLLIAQQPSAGAVELRLTRDDADAALPASVAPRAALVRIR
ncbi:MAG: hypothetical protein H0T44_04500 [Gemmatimonadales bacterium]|nr:hypothetical protein [Gemmatimonadales bacterium]MDQ3426946.1 hypothetical protein [Gemmatimonadota bacterium]